MSRISEHGWLRTRRTVSSFHELEVCGSTNAHALARTNPEPFSIVVSWNQTNGIGRHGRQWVSTPNDSLAVSLFFPGWDSGGEEVTRERSSWIPLLAGVAAVEALTSCTNASFTLKWPNDVLLRQRKVAGILTQAHPSGGYVIGLGLNVYQSEDRPAGNAIAIGEVTRIPNDFDDLVVSSFVLRFQEKISKSTSQFPGLVKDVLDTLGGAVRVEEIGKDPWVGKAVGLGARGELVVSNEEGARILVQAADVWHLRAADD